MTLIEDIEDLGSLNYAGELNNKKNRILACIIIPTYNEANNIKKLLSLVYGRENTIQYRQNNISMEVLVVDDSSPDGTASKVREYQKKNPRVHLLLREEKNGLGSAYIAGMKHAMLTIKPDILFEMDADLSHDPKYIMPMIMEVIKGADFVIGSRYIDGGSIPHDWGILRRLTSSSANKYTKFILGISNVRDCTGGFRAIRSSIIRKIGLDALGSRGYVFQISLLDAVLRSKGIVKEIPISFQNRNSGKSKMSINDIAEVGMTVLRMGLQRISARVPALGEEPVFGEEEHASQSIIKV